MSSSSSSSNLAALRAKLATLSGAQKATPLWVFLYMYSQAQHVCYVDYMEGAKELYNYLRPLSLPTNLPQAPILNYMGDYETLELAKIVCEYPTHYDASVLAETNRLIITCTIHQVASKMLAAGIKI